MRAELHGERPEGAPAAAVVDEAERAVKHGRMLLCRACGHAITRASDRLDEARRFTNMYGQHFEIARFADAPGCRAYGPRSSYWTWFPGHTWQAALCGACTELLGWLYKGESCFFGLIVERLVEPS